MLDALPIILEPSGKAKRYARSTRVWHWLNLLIICGSLGTVLVNSLLFDHAQRTFVRSELANAGANVSDKQAAAVLHGLEDQVWAFHIYFGYALTVLFLFRLIAEFFLSAEQRIFPKLKRAYQNFWVLKKYRITARHELLVKGLYLVFYFLLLIMTLTGLLLAFQEQTGLSKDVNHSIKEFHGFSMYLILGFILLHIAGVILAERKDEKGMVSDMIGGGDA
ncbi:cytochrome b/b6 domain-containing protein [Pedobacter soli]|uniref:Ni,Fe-hydrogenase I cytochrome b subunit n=1 Tax=Pedobacter soli TaxID=390242 RepID=A0A1G7AY05_9SPHI|nr:cytochrome b/b6 domain-containing protein [Pedobacter soli]SDE19758.1 Ni,Fe-hydrogenase I cytochrome b subunit [Pedobacter soli]